MTTTRQQVEAWLLEDRKRGYSQAARKFGCSKSDATEWGKAIRSGSRAPARSKPTEAPAASPQPLGTWASLDRGAYLRKQIEGTGEDLEGARGKQSWIAVEKLRRLLDKQVGEYEVWKKEHAAEIEGAAPDEELLEALAAELRDLPLDQLEQLHEVIQIRMGLKVA